MITVNQNPASVEIESLGHWRLDGKPVDPGTRLVVLPSLAADLISRGKARRPLAAQPALKPEPEATPEPAPEPEAAPEPALEPAPETPPAAAPAARGKK